MREYLKYLKILTIIFLIILTIKIILNFWELDEGWGFDHKKYYSELRNELYIYVKEQHEHESDVLNVHKMAQCRTNILLKDAENCKTLKCFMDNTRKTEEEKDVIKEYCRSQAKL